MVSRRRRQALDSKSWFWVQVSSRSNNVNTEQTGTQDWTGNIAVPGVVLRSSSRSDGDAVWPDRELVIPPASWASSRITAGRPAGVTVTATGPALQVPSVTAVSDDRGEYRLSPLPIGVYSVLFELPGFQTIRREGVRLTVGFTARVDTELNMGGVADTITVSGASPLVDTTSTATSTELTREQLEVLPTSRDGFHAFMNQAPGVRTNLDVGAGSRHGGFRFLRTGHHRADGEGVLARSHVPGAQVSHGRLQRDRGNASQTSAATRRCRGGLLVESVLKAGGNDFTATIGVWVGVGAGDDKIDDSLAAAGIGCQAAQVQDFAGPGGGNQDRLWFFGGYRISSKPRDPDAWSCGTPILNLKGGGITLKGHSEVADKRSPGSSTGPRSRDAQSEPFRARESMEDKEPRWITKASGRRARQKPGRLGESGDEFRATLQHRPGEVSRSTSRRSAGRHNFTITDGQGDNVSPRGLSTSSPI